MVTEAPGGVFQERDRSSVLRGTTREAVIAVALATAKVARAKRLSAAEAPPMPATPRVTAERRERDGLLDSRPEERVEVRAEAGLCVAALGGAGPRAVAVRGRAIAPAPAPEKYAVDP